MKKSVFVLLCFLCLCFMSGCGVIKLTEKETGEIAEYMAGKLLEYDRHYEDALIPEERLPEPEVQEPEAEPSQEPEEEPKEPSSGKPGKKEDAPKASSDLNQVFGQKGIRLSYRDYKKCSSYPEDTSQQYFVVEAGLGKQLVVVEFSLKNTTGSDIQVSLLDSELSYQLVLKGGSKSPLKSWLTDDLQFLERKISAGKSAKAHLIFEVEHGTKLKKASVSVTKGNSSAQVPLA